LELDGLIERTVFGVPGTGRGRGDLGHDKGGFRPSGGGGCNSRGGGGDIAPGADLLKNNDLVHVVEFVPVLFERTHIPIKGLEFWATRNSHVERFCCEERALIEEVGEADIGVVCHRRQRTRPVSMQNGELNASARN